MIVMHPDRTNPSGSPEVPSPPAASDGAGTDGAPTEESQPGFRPAVDLSSSEELAGAQVAGERRFWELLEASTDAIVEIDGAGRILLANSAAEKLCGYPREELLVAGMELLMGTEFRAQHQARLKEYAAAPAARMMGGGRAVQLTRKDGTQVPVEISLRPTRVHEELRVTAIIHDVSDREKAEQLVRAAKAQLEVRNREVARASRLQKDLLDSVSHELRTPLHTIIGFTELLQEELEGPLNDTQKRFLRHVYSDALHLLEMVNDILDINAIEAGRLDLQLTSFDAAACIEEAIGTIAEMAALKSVQIENHVTAPLMIQADRDRFGEVIYNLLSNAVKFNRENGKLGIEAELAGDRVRFCVWDTGVGIAPEQCATIFDRFGQAGTRQRGSGQGTGLGLPITRRLVELHGGSVWVESRVGEGSRFYGTFPAASA